MMPILSDQEWAAHAQAARNAIRAYRRAHDEDRPLAFTPHPTFGGGLIRLIAEPGRGTLAGEVLAGYQVDLCAT